MQTELKGFPESLTPFSCGVDVVELERFTRILKVGGQQFLKRVYTNAELVFCAGRLPQLAARFAGKEAISKALGTGMRGIHWGEMEVLSDQYGCPFVSLYGHAAVRAKQMHLFRWAISLSHSPTFVVAFVIASLPDSLPCEGIHTG